MALRLIKLKPMNKRKLRARRNEQENGNQVIMKKRKDKLERQT